MTLLVGRLEGHPVCKKLGVGLLVVTIDWSFARVITPVVATTCITLSSNKIENGDILVPANPGPPEKNSHSRYHIGAKFNVLYNVICCNVRCVC